jgi:hypothetical protein
MFSLYALSAWHYNTDSKKPTSYLREGGLLLRP